MPGSIVLFKSPSHCHSQGGYIDLLDHCCLLVTCASSSTLGRGCKWKGFAAGFQEEFVPGIKLRAKKSTRSGGLVCIKVKELQNGEYVKDTVKSSRFGILSMKAAHTKLQQIQAASVPAKIKGRVRKYIWTDHSSFNRHLLSFLLFLF